METIKIDNIELEETIDLLLKISKLHYRDYDSNQKKLIDKLSSFEKNSDSFCEFINTWDQLTTFILSTPYWFSLLLDDTDTTLSQDALKNINKIWLPEHIKDKSHIDWLARLHDLQYKNAVIVPYLHKFVTNEYNDSRALIKIRQLYFFKDWLVAWFVLPEYIDLQNEIFSICEQQLRNWNFSYVSGYPYQGLEKIGISGAKPTEERLKRYNITQYLSKNDAVLDIGSNCGFLSMEIARYTRKIDAIEFNPYLNMIAQKTSHRLGIENISLHQIGFAEFTTSKKYQSIFSLANHCTIDGNFSMNFEEYIAKCFHLLDTDGYLFFESHSVFAPGNGGVGDDGDLDEKFDIVERYFEVIEYFMTPTYIQYVDIDKLFVVLKRRECYDATAKRTLSLKYAKTIYRMK
ncbi:hypothetical protein [Aeromonas enteropelogenes]|uniref:hypothetical protein n=1 Tax=Aeromonas enteropelogenes TaxID=29489 RepID=UPI003BA3788C